jgi:hypothetical protein
VSLLSRIGSLVARRIRSTPEFQERVERQQRAVPYWMAARDLAYSSMPDEQVQAELRSRLGTDDIALADAIEFSAHRRSDFISDRGFRLLSAVAEDAPVRPIDPALVDLFNQEEEIGRLPLGEAFQRLAQLEPGLKGVAAQAESEAIGERGGHLYDPKTDRVSGRNTGQLVGIAARSGVPL